MISRPGFSVSKHLRQTCPPEPQPQPGFTGISRRHEPYPASRIEDKAGRNAADGVVAGYQLFCVVQDPIVNASGAHVGAYCVSRSGIHCHAEDGMILCQGINGALFEPADRAPGCPEMQQYRFAPETGERYRCSVQQGSAEFWCRATWGVTCMPGICSNEQREDYRDFQHPALPALLPQPRHACCFI